jgi:heme/copper-type cytochrome/quinol oxidase subunit 2
MSSRRSALVVVAIVAGVVLVALWLSRRKGKAAPTPAGPVPVTSVGGLEVVTWAPPPVVAELPIFAL